MKPVLGDFSDAALSEAIEACAVAGCKAWAVWPELEYHEEPDLTWTLTHIPFSVFNGAFEARFAPDEVDARIDAVIARAAARDVPMMWWTGPSTRPAELGTVLQAKGFTLAARVQGMAVNLDALVDDLPVPEGLEIDEVRDHAALEAWGRLTARVFDFPDFSLSPWIEMHAAMGIGVDRPWRHFIARLGDKPVGASSLFCDNDVAGIASVATLPDFRRQGIGSAISLTPLCVARHDGYHVGTLCASAMGVSAYRRLGFLEHGESLRVYSWEPTTART
jgi:GNAT superfamily N-acetyltransferase